MLDFSAHAVRGDLRRAMGAIVDIAGSKHPPRCLAVGSYRLDMVRSKIAELTANYDEWQHVTSNT